MKSKYLSVPIRMILNNSFFWFDRQSDYNSQFTVHGIGFHERMNESLVNRPGGTGDCLLMVFHDVAQVKCNGSIHEVSPGSMVIWDSSMGHYYGSDRDEWEHSWLHCGGVAEKLIKQSGIPLGRSITDCDELFLDTLQQLYDEKIDPEYSPTILENLFQNCLLRIKRQIMPSTSNQIPDRLLSAKRLIENSYTKKLTLKELAKVSSFSASHFSAEYKRYFGISPLQYQNRLRMKEAAYLLRNINLSISEIAEMVGYPDIYHFSKQFKKYYDQSPKSMRDQTT